MSPAPAEREFTRVSTRHSVLPSLDEPTATEYAELARRNTAFLVSRDPRDLWPGASLPAIQVAASAIGRAVECILGGANAELTPEGFSPQELGVAALVTGVGPLLGFWRERGELATDEAMGAVLDTHLRHGRARDARIRACMRVVSDALAARGVGPGVIKGFHTGEVYFPDPGVRPFSDVDLIVRAEEIPAAREVLRALAFHEGEGYRRPYKREWRASDDDGRIRSFDYWHANNGWSVELYDGLSFDFLHGHGTRLRAVAALDGEWQSGGGMFRVPTQPQLIALLAVHASGELYASRLLRLVELVLVARKDVERGTLDWHAVGAFLDDARASRFAYPAFRLADQLVPGVIDANVLRACERASTNRTRAVVASFTPTSPVLQRDTSLSQRLMWARGWLGVVRRVWTFVRPLRGASPRVMLRNYHSRLWRIVTGSVRIGGGADKRSDFPS